MMNAAAKPALMAVLLALACGNAGQDLYALVYGAGGVYVELALSYGLHHFLSKHEVLDIAGGYHHPLVASEALGLAHVEKAFDFVVDASYGLYLALLVDGACDGDSLFDGKVCKA